MAGSSIPRHSRSYLTPLFLAKRRLGLTLFPLVSPTDPVCSLVNSEGQTEGLGILRRPPGRGQWEGGTCPWAQRSWQEADFPFSFHFQEKRRAASLRSPQENLPAIPLAQPTSGKVTQPSPSYVSLMPEMDHAAGRDCWGQTRPSLTARKAPPPSTGATWSPGLLSLHALGPPAVFFPLKVTGLSTPGIFTHQTGPVSNTHHKYAF